ncbi:MAG: hypothetical protein JXA38_05655 [Methanosarcinaceae archaeon]|nr:hypothetical protein [Methanosarcinaceae archaeon]
MVHACENRGIIRLDDPRRRGNVDVSITFDEFVLRFCRYTERKTQLFCPECGNLARCIQTAIKENFDVVGTFSCSCRNTFRRKVKAPELRRRYKEKRR